MLRKLATAAMREAVYFDTGTVDASEWGHYGLGVSHYTHFTSPIRRFADVIVHRQLMAALAIEQQGVDGCVVILYSHPLVTIVIVLGLCKLVRAYKTPPFFGTLEITPAANRI